MAKAKEKKEKGKSFEEYLGEIEKIVEDLESGEIDLEDAIKKYEKGMGLIDKCSAVLRKSRLKIEELKKKAASEESGGEEFDEDGGYAVEKDEEEDPKAEDEDDDRDDGKLPF